MKLFKKINNNFVIGEDSNGERIIVEGLGLGFMKLPCDLQDISKVSRTYYGFDQSAIGFLQKVNPTVLSIANEVYDRTVVLLSAEVSENLPFILADHLDFCIVRYKKKMQLSIPVDKDFNSTYPVELKLADYALRLVREQMDITLPEVERIGIALNIINAELTVREKHQDDVEELLQETTRIIERVLGQNIDQESFNYSRFATHFRYLITRLKGKEKIETSYSLYLACKEKYSQASDAVEEISKYLSKHGYQLYDEEKLYLILHVQRLNSHEDCNRN